MAYWIDNNSNSVDGQVGFYCDSDSDIANLPTMTSDGVEQPDSNVSCRKVKKGSTCLSIGSSTLYILNSSNIWTAL